MFFFQDRLIEPQREFLYKNQLVSLYCQILSLISLYKFHHLLCCKTFSQKFYSTLDQENLVLILNESLIVTDNAILVICKASVTFDCSHLC